MLSANNLIYPGDEVFDYYLGILPPVCDQLAHQYSGQIAYVAEAGSGILKPANTKEMEEYLYGGEYEERLQEIGEEDGLLNGMD